MIFESRASTYDQPPEMRMHFAIPRRSIRGPGMPLLQLDLDRSEHPVDIIERIAAHNHWSFDRDEQDISVKPFSPARCAPANAITRRFNLSSGLAKPGPRRSPRSCSKRKAGPEMDSDAVNMSLLLAGAGKMGGALLRAWLDRGYDPRKINVIEPHPRPELIELARAKGFALEAPSRPPQVLVLAIKPQSLDEAAASLAFFASPSTLVVSILAGKTIAN